MDILLINPSSSLINKNWAYKKFFTPIAPLGLAYIAVVLEKAGFKVVIIDQFATKMSNKELLDFIKDKKPPLVGFSALTPVLPDIKKLIAGIRQVSQESKIVLGNIHATLFCEDLLKEGVADIIVRGEGEYTVVDLCKNINNPKALFSIPGISFKFDGQIINNPEREILEDLDKLPFPAWHLLNLDNYTEVPLVGITKSRAFPIAASRGCDYRCYYCSQDKIYKKVRYRNLNLVVDEMEYFHENLQIKFFGFCDAYFPFNEKSGIEFCSLLIKRGLHKKVRWCTETRVDKVTPALLKIMKESGAHLIMYGVEVGNASILKSLDKRATLEQATSAFRETRKARIMSQGLFILGLPGETKASCLQTINFAKKLDCDFAKFNLAIPYPGSAFFEEYKKKKKLERFESFNSWYDWLNSSEELIYTPDGMDSQTLRDLQRKAMREFYLRPKVIFRHISKGTINLTNLFLGGVWLISLLTSAILNKFRNFIVKKDSFKDKRYEI